MIGFWTSLLVGLGIGLIIIFPIGLGIYLLIKRTKERRMIKKMIFEKKFLQPIDPRDYDTQTWDKKMSQEDLDQNKEKLSNLNDKIFKKEKNQDA